MIKQFEQFMNEQNNHNGKEIISFIEKLSMITDGYQKQFYEKMLSDAKIVKCTSVYNILTENEIKKIKGRVRPVVKECYKNSYLLTKYGIIPETSYCEGYMNYMGIPIEHAFNKVGDKYIDITAELVLERDVDGDEYVVFGEYTKEDVLDIMLEINHYGGIYYNQFIKNIDEKK